MGQQFREVVAFIAVKVLIIWEYLITIDANVSKEIIIWLCEGKKQEENILFCCFSAWEQ